MFSCRGEASVCSRGMAPALPQSVPSSPEDAARQFRRPCPPSLDELPSLLLSSVCGNRHSDRSLLACGQTRKLPPGARLPTLRRVGRAFSEQDGLDPRALLSKSTLVGASANPGGDTRGCLETRRCRRIRSLPHEASTARIGHDHASTNVSARSTPTVGQERVRIEWPKDTQAAFPDPECITTESRGSECPSDASSRTSTPVKSETPGKTDKFVPKQGYFRKGMLIGSGSYGSVFKAQCSGTGGIFAVKELVADPRNGDDARFLEKLTVELDICRSLSHPNIVEYLSHVQDGARLSIFLEYVPGGSMSDLLNTFGPLNQALLKKASRGALDGLEYLHSRNPPIVHRDLKSSNLLVTLDLLVKLADFGCSKRNSVTTSFTTVGSIPWMAPEVIMQEKGHGRKADVWSYGCTVIEMATGEPPWGKDVFNSVMHAMRHIGMSEASPPVPEDLPAECQTFIWRSLRRAASERPSAAEFLADPFLFVEDVCTTTRAGRQ